MRVLFAGSPEIAVPTLLGIARRHSIVGILTNPESGKGRGLVLAPTPVALAAKDISGGQPPVLAFERLGAEARSQVEMLRPDILVVFAYGRIFGPKFLSLFPEGGINIHPSILPKYRGCAPIPQAILNRDAETGVSVQRIALEMDCGDILAMEKIPLDRRETTLSLSGKAATLGAGLAVEVLARIEAGIAVARPQEGDPSYCFMIKKDDGLIDWSLGAAEIDARVRAYQPWPGAFTFFGTQRLTILESEPFPGESISELPGTVLALDRSRGIMVQTIDGTIALKRLQMPTKKALPFKEFANGVRSLAGARLGIVPS